MGYRDGIADLHLHTTRSDGTATVDERVRAAGDEGLAAIAITDHDAIAPTLEDRIHTRDGVDVITGVEVRADVGGTKVEILGYYVDPGDAELQGLLDRAREFRRERNRALVANLASATGLDLSYERLTSDVDGELGRPHLASVLVAEGVVPDVQAAFDRYLAKDGECFVPMERHDFESVVDAIHGAGGVSSLAHPGRIRASAEEVESIVEHLVDAGLDAIEVVYPYDDDRTDDYAAINVARARTLADDYDLLATGGSDCHGPNSGKHRIGSVRLSASTLERLRARAADRAAL